MTAPIFFTLTLVLFYVGITLTFMNKEHSQKAPVPVPVRTSSEQASR
ncbi:hypothetical protein [Luteolibacter soli]|uniref:Uncharacterized protein n=1 Tax=Luteolibacter soli TaxID=3135280 RepID=A0ABU9ATZ0_9BACT